MSVYTTSDKPTDDLGVGTFVRLKAKGDLRALINPPQTRIEPTRVVEFRTVPVEYPLTWAAWWSFTKRLLAQTWRKAVSYVRPD